MRLYALLEQVALEYIPPQRKFYTSVVAVRVALSVTRPRSLRSSSHLVCIGSESRNRTGEANICCWRVLPQGGPGQDWPDDAGCAPDGGVYCCPLSNLRRMRHEGSPACLNPRAFMS